MSINLKKKPLKISSRRDLRDFQRIMTQSLLVPLNSDERMQKKWQGRSMEKVAASFIKPNDRLTAFERLEIYNRQYWFRLRTCFDEDFPGLRTIIGDRPFAVLTEAYLKDKPSRSFTLRNLGSRLVPWLRKHPEYLGKRRVEALDMARLEWAHIEAFDEEARTPISGAALAGKNPAKLRLRLQPYLRLLDLHYPVDDWLIEAKNGGAAEQVASNAVREPKKRSQKSAAPQGKAERVFLAAHRFEGSVYYKRLDPEAFALLQALGRGESLAAASLSAFRRSKLSADQQADLLQKSFSNWAALGWFCE